MTVVNPLIQMQNQVKSAKLLVQAHREDIKRSQERKAQVLADLEQYEKAVELLKPLGVSAND